MILLYMLLALAIAGLHLESITRMKINLLEAQAKTLRYTAQEPKKVEKYNEIKELENEMKVFKEEVDKIIKWTKALPRLIS